jgi:hypothetical protein
VIFCGVAAPRRKKSLKERHLHDSRLIFTPKLKRTQNGMCFKVGVKISGVPTGRRRDLIFDGGARLRRQKSIKGKAFGGQLSTLHLFDLHSCSFG